MLFLFSFTGGLWQYDVFYNWGWGNKVGSVKENTTFGSQRSLEWRPDQILASCLSQWPESEK